MRKTTYIWFINLISLIMLMTGCTVATPAVPAPTDRGKELFAFAVFGDPGGISEQMKEIVSQLQTKNIAFVVGAGDYSEGKSAKELQQFNEYLQDNLNLPYYLAVGDNDRMLQGGVRTTDAFEKNSPNTRLHRWEYLGNYFIILDSSDETVGYTERDLAWLENQLEPLADKSVFIFTHIPPNMPLLQTNPGTEKFIELSEQYNVDQIFSGHYHGHLSYTVGTKNQIPVEITGGAGSLPQFGQTGEYHYIVIKVFEIGHEINLLPIAL